MRFLIFVFVVFYYPIQMNAQVYEAPLSTWDAEYFGIPESTSEESLLFGRERWELVGSFAERSRLRQLSKSIGRLKIDLSDKVAHCTAFIISDDTIMTNYHCVPGTKGRVERVRFELGFFSETSNPNFKRFEIDPKPISSDEGLDYSILKSKEPFGKPWKIASLSKEEVLEGAPLQIFHHPAGQPMRVSRSGCLGGPASDRIQKGYFQHKCDTLKGSSGAPIFNEKGAVVGIHHRGSIDRASYALNQGTHVSSMAADSNVVFETDEMREIPDQIEDFSFSSLVFSKTDVRYKRLQQYKRNCLPQNVFGDSKFFDEMVCSSETCRVDYTRWRVSGNIKNSILFLKEDIYAEKITSSSQPRFVLTCVVGKCITDTSNGKKFKGDTLSFSDPGCGNLYIGLETRLDK